MKKPTKSSASSGAKKAPAKAKAPAKKTAKGAKPAASKKPAKRSLWDRLFKK